MLTSFYQKKFIEAGCDEAGRGCYAGPVYAAAVILPRRFKHSLINDSKKLTAVQREEARAIIEEKAIAWSVSQCTHNEIDQLNILRASIKAMHKAIDGLKQEPQLLLIDGNHFYPYKNIPYKTIIKGDGLYASIAAASILAKTYRDEWMVEAHKQFPQYGWDKNKGYGTLLHRQAILEYGLSPFHRSSFNILPKQQVTIQQLF